MEEKERMQPQLLLASLLRVHYAIELVQLGGKGTSSFHSHLCHLLARGAPEIWVLSLLFSLMYCPEKGGAMSCQQTRLVALGAWLWPGGGDLSWIKQCSPHPASLLATGWFRPSIFHTKIITISLNCSLPFSSFPMLQLELSL